MPARSAASKERSAYRSAAVARSGASSIARVIAARNGSPSCRSAFALPIARQRLSSIERLRLELERALQHRERLVELVAADRELGGPAEPGDRLRAKPLQLGVLAGPGQVGVLGSRRLGVVVREQGGVLAAAVSDPLEPGREGGMQARAPRLRDARVRDLARQRVPERELAARPRAPSPAAAGRSRAPRAGRSRGRLRPAARTPGRARRRARSRPPPAERPSRSRGAGRSGPRGRRARCRGSRAAAGCALGQARVQLLEEERVSLGALDEERADLPAAPPSRTGRRAGRARRRPAAARARPSPRSGGGPRPGAARAAPAAPCRRAAAAPRPRRARARAGRAAAPGPSGGPRRARRRAASTTSSSRKATQPACSASRAASGWSSASASWPSTRPRISWRPSRSDTVSGASVSSRPSCSRSTSAIGR